MSKGSNTIPANLQPYVEALGEEQACLLILELGGSEIYLSNAPKSGSIVSKVIGVDGAKALAKVFGSGGVKVPIARKWTTQYLLDKGWAIAKIARAIRVDENTIRRWRREAPDKNQLSLTF